MRMKIYSIIVIISVSCGKVNGCFSVLPALRSIDLSKIRPSVLFIFERFALKFGAKTLDGKIPEFEGIEYVPDVVKKEGYPLETHRVITSDGYVIGVHRIPHGNGTEAVNQHRKPILLTHCFLCASSGWVLPGSKTGFAYILSRAGYDVWMMNSRGTSYSREHLHLKDNDNKFWDFSFHEVGLEDLRYTIDYIIEATSQSTVDFIGFSMGNMNFFVLMSTHPEYNYKIGKAALMAPSGYVGEASSTFRRMMGSMPLARDFLGSLGLSEEMPPSKFFMNRIMRGICGKQFFPFNTICNMVWSVGEGSSLENVSQERREKFFSSFPNRGSLRSGLHMNQLVNSGQFQKYDYGVLKNVELYGRKQPPTYNLSRVVAPTGIFWSRDDNLESTNGIARIASELPNIRLKYEIPFKNFLHTNYIWDDDAADRLYSKVIKFLQEPL